MFGIDDMLLGAIAGPAVSGGLGLLGGILGNTARSDIASSSNAFAAAQSQQQMDFQERMRNTQYQAATKDMMSAGLNPMLAYSQGGAGNLAGAKAEPTVPEYESPLKSALASASEYKMFSKEVELKNQEIRNRSLEADAKEPVAAAARKAMQGYDKISEVLPDLGGSAASIVDTIKSEVLPGLSSGASAVVRKAVDLASEGASSARDVIRSLPDKVKSMISNSASSVANLFKGDPSLRGAVIPPALGRASALNPARRGALGSARSWDFGATRSSGRGSSGGW